MRNICEIINLSALRAPDDLALVSGTLRLSFLELCHHVNEASQALCKLRIAPGERVAVWLDKRVETIVSIFAAANIGAVFVPINPQLKPDQVSHILEDSGSSALITTKVRSMMLGKRVSQCTKLRVVALVDDDAANTKTDHPRTVSWKSLVNEPMEPIAAPSVLDEDVAAILYTSGSTGLPKGVVLSHRNLIEGARSVAEYLGNGAHDRILSVLPLSFDAGLSQITTAFLSGATAVLSNFLVPNDIVQLCEQEGITGITGVPALWHQIAKADWSNSARQSLRYFANTGGHMPSALLGQLRDIFPNARPFLMYGLTEAFRSTYLDPVEVDRRPDSVGRAIPNARILVLRPDGSECGPNEVGELVHIGAHVAQGYWNSPDLTAERFKPWQDRDAPGIRPRIAVWSGDLVRRDADGFLYFVERADSMIKTSGYRVSPTEVEEVLLGCIGIREAVVVGIPHDELGQQIAAWVVVNSDFDPDRAAEHCRRKLPAYMAPARWIVASELPMTGNGKYDRKDLARRAIVA